MKLLAIDPGTPPTLALLHEGRVTISELEKVALAIRGKTKSGKDNLTWELSPMLYAAAIVEHEPDMVLIENNGIRPGENLASGLKYYSCIPMAVGVCVARGIPYRLVTSVQWKKALKLPGKLHPNAKELTRKEAISRFPQDAGLFVMQKHHNRADAALLAFWGTVYAKW